MNKYLKSIALGVTLLCLGVGSANAGSSATQAVKT